MATFDSILYVNRDKIDIYSGGKMVVFPFLPTFIKDLEIVDKELFKTQLFAFLDKNAITLGASLVLLSESVCFISEPITPKENPDEVLELFLMSLPFNNPTARILENKVIGTNKDLYEAINDVVAQKGVRIKTVSPAFLSKEMVGKKILDSEMIKFISSNENIFIKAAFSFESPLPAKFGEVGQGKKRSKREVVLIWTFVALLAIFAIWVLTRAF